MKRLVVCFDGTARGPTDVEVSNVERLARTVEQREGRSEVPQQVLYVGGVGSDFYRTNRLLGGIWGLGLLSNLVIGYRWLVLAWEPGDEIYLFGFSRGAFTARSLAGIVDRVGLLTRRALVDGRLRDALRLYSRLRSGGAEARDEAFKSAHCHPRTPIRLIGVLDTVGALGPRGRFHDLTLGPDVQHARHALARDERRLAFEPLLWTGPSGTEPGRVDQVWFPGSHSDVGGGYPGYGIPDLTLAWLAGEAQALGLVLDEDLLAEYLASGAPPVVHDSLNPGWRLLNTILRAWHLVRPNPAFDGGRRVLRPPGARDVRVWDG